MTIDERPAAPVTSAGAAGSRAWPEDNDQRARRHLYHATVRFPRDRSRDSQARAKRRPCSCWGCDPRVGRGPSCSSARRETACSTQIGRDGAAQESNLPSRGLHDRTGFEGLHEQGRLGRGRMVPSSQVRSGALRGAQVGRKFGRRSTESGVPLSAPAGSAALAAARDRTRGRARVHERRRAAARPWTPLPRLSVRREADGDHLAGRAEALRAA
jgi:hypothetical protein